MPNISHFMQSHNGIATDRSRAAEESTEIVHDDEEDLEFYTSALNQTGPERERSRMHSSRLEHSNSFDNSLSRAHDDGVEMIGTSSFLDLSGSVVEKRRRWRESGGGSFNSVRTDRTSDSGDPEHDPDHDRDRDRDLDHDLDLEDLDCNWP